jgi:hypothetical protein
MDETNHLLVKEMAEEVKLNFVNKIVYGAIGGAVLGVFNTVLQFLFSAINVGFDAIDYNSQQYLGTTAGNPNVVGILLISVVSSAFLGIVYGFIIFLLLKQAGWERNLTTYLIVAIVVGIVIGTLPFILLIPTAEFDIIVDGLIYLIIAVIVSSILGLTFYYLEEQFG